ncbi:MAG: DUF502 domain-containing protein [Deltaproteobacteria bacterium]|nr:DUF502 domain-containing protein [Deltaproteobacteria bacterium]
MLKRLRAHFRTTFLAGLLVLFPLVSTIWILRIFVQWGEGLFLGLIPHYFQPTALLGLQIPGLGFLLTLLIIWSVGLVTRLYLARSFIALGEAIVQRIPIARGIYQGVKRLMQLVVGSPGQHFSRVVIVPCFSEHSRAYGFVTGETVNTDAHGQTVRYVRVFVPTTPNPTSGFLLLVPEAATTPTELSVEQASKLIISGGLV